MNFTQKTFFLAFFLASCGSAKDEKDSSLSYGTFSPGASVVRQWSAYTTIEENGCTLPMNLYTNGVSLSQGQINLVASYLDQAVRTWTGAISSPSWTCGQAGISWQSPSPKAIQVTIDATNQRAYSLVGEYKVFLGPSILNGDPNNEKVVLHEMGHMFGLSDTYSEAGYQQPLNQPPGIMGNLYAVPGLMDDDIRGANALYDYINQRAPFCRDGYSPAGAYENRNQVAFCAPGGRSYQTPLPAASDQTRWLKIHNQKRCMHGLLPLEWSQEAANAAQKWANTCIFAHEDQRPWGDNLAWGTRGWFTPELAGNAWYGESRGYPYGSPTPPYQTMHFTQMVWRETTAVGCARKECSYGTYFVCRYTKRGNILGRFGPSVPRPVKSESQCLQIP